MKRDKLIHILNNEFPPIMESEGDFNGLQIIGKEKINKVMVVLDMTIDIISQAMNSKIDMIITHHPLFFGNKKELMNHDPLLKGMVKILVENKINVYSIHTPADFAPNSIAFNQALSLEMNEITQLENNIAIIGKFEEETTLKEIVNRVRSNLNLSYSFRTNSELSTYYKNIIIGSGASGNLVKDNNAIGKLLIVGEMKHNNWVEANKLNINVLEIGHYSEHIFKTMVEVLLSETKIEVILGEEKNGYKHV